MKKKLYLIIAISVILVISGVLAYLVRTGQIKTWADSGNSLLPTDLSLRHFAHIRTYASVYADSTSFSNFVGSINSKFDLIRSNYISSNLTNTFNLKYINLTDINQAREEYLRLNEDCKTSNQNFDDFFIHYAKDTVFIGRKELVKSIKPDRFSAVLLAKTDEGPNLTNFSHITIVERFEQTWIRLLTENLKLERGLIRILC